MKIVITALLFALAACKPTPLYNPLKSYVAPITVLNFESQVNKLRQTTKYVSIVHYYKSTGIYGYILSTYRRRIPSIRS